MKKNFRKEAGSVYSTTADEAAAKALLSEAGVSSGSFAITYRSDRAYDVKVAEYAKAAWEKLGFTVELKGLDVKAYETALYSGDFDVIALDYQGLTTNAYSALAPFVPAYSGSVVSVEDGASGVAPHVTGYASEAYTKLLDELLEATQRKERVKKLIEVEKIMAEECPAIALVHYSNAYLASSELKGLETSPYGYTDFTNATIKNYKEKNEAYLAEKEAADKATQEAK
jgi:oligopeptide transport system substrate-binding protein